jgi:undecaprenyl-diphosphatase
MVQKAATARRIQSRWPLVSGLGALALGILLGVVIALRGNGALRIDAEWMEEIVEHRSPLWDLPARVMNVVGGTLVTTLVTIVIMLVLLVLRRRWTAMYIALAVITSNVLVQVLKILLSRARPQDILISIQSGSFPSGHVANAATLAVVLAIVTWRWWVVVAGGAYVLLMALSRTYLGAHWVSDTIGGLIIGAAIAVIVWAPFAERVLSERVLSERRADAVASNP